MSKKLKSFISRKKAKKTDKKRILTSTFEFHTTDLCPSDGTELQDSGTGYKFCIKCKQRFPVVGFSHV